MSKQNMREASEREWLTKSDGATHDRINCGSLQRIADATEVMARTHQALIDEREGYRRGWQNAKSRINYLERSNAALRGCITKLKKGGSRSESINQRTDQKSPQSTAQPQTETREIAGSSDGAE